MDPSPVFHYLLGRIHQRRNELQSAVSQFRACLSRLGMPQLRYVCSCCGARSRDWLDRCEACGRWSSVDLDVILVIAGAVMVLVFAPRAAPPGPTPAKESPEPHQEEAEPDLEETP